MDRPDQSDAQTIYARRKWSAERLEIPLKASKQEARKLWLQRLEAADFLPDEIDLPAWRIVSSGDSATEARRRFPEWASQYDDAIGGEIEVYAQRFFELDPAVRRQEFTRLFNASRDNARQQQRLSTLAPGLKLPAFLKFDHAQVVESEPTAVDVRKLSQHLRAMFVAAPPARARLHHAFLGEYAQDQHRWMAAANVLKAEQSPFIELVPEQWEELTGWEVRQHLSAFFQAELKDRVAIQAVETKRAEARGNDSSGSFLQNLLFNRYSLFVIVWISIKLVGGTFSSSNHRPTQFPNVSNLPSQEDPLRELEGSLDELLAKLEKDGKKIEARKWITMGEEDFQFANGEEKIKELGLESKRREYLEWRAKFDHCDKSIFEKRILLDQLRSRFEEQDRLEDAWKLYHPQSLNELDRTTPPPGTQKTQPSFAKSELDKIRQAQTQLKLDLQTAETTIGELEAELDTLNSSDPSDDPFDESP